MRILIVRHADPNYEQDTLTEKGWKEARLLAERLKKEKIDYWYSSPYGRAKDTCMAVAREMGREADVQVMSFLREFDVEKAAVLPDGKEKIHMWDLLPEFWTKQEDMYDKDNWWKCPCFHQGNVKEEYDKIIAQLDQILAKYGYVWDNGLYRVEKPNRDTVIFFCHFGVEMMLLSRLLNASPIVLTHHFVALPSSVTTLYSEERREGIATFRCCGYGDISHLYAGNEPPSFSARFCETFDSDERHD